MRRALGFALAVTLCFSATGSALAVHLHFAAHSHSHDDGNCPTCFYLTVGSNATVNEPVAIIANGSCFCLATTHGDSPIVAREHHVGSPRAPPIS